MASFFCVHFSESLAKRPFANGFNFTATFFDNQSTTSSHTLINYISQVIAYLSLLTELY
ncbi:MAG: hypothetical protein QMC13_02210 [Colwellia sp.]